MPRAPHSPARKLAIVALARLSGPEEAARVAGAAASSVREWMAGTSNDPRLADWQAARDYAMEQQLRATIEGNASKAYAWSKAAGVSQRNVDMAPRSAKAEEETPDPGIDAQVREAWHALPEERARWMRDYIDLRIELDFIAYAAGQPDTLREYALSGATTEEIGKRMAGDRQDVSESMDILKWLTDATEAQLAAEVAKVQAEAAALMKGWHAYPAHHGQKVFVDAAGRTHRDLGRNDLLFTSVPVLVDQGDGRNVTPELEPEQRALIAEAQLLLEEIA